MGLCPSTPGKRTFINQEVSFEHSTENRAELLGTQMSERSSESDFNSFLELHNATAKKARQWFENMNVLSTENHDLKKQTDQLGKENQSLRQRWVEDNFLDLRKHSRKGLFDGWKSFRVDSSFHCPQDAVVLIGHNFNSSSSLGLATNRK